MAAASTASGDSAAALKPGPKVDEPKTVYDFVCEQIGTKRAIDMAEYSGRVLLIVNTASKCGYTWQYEPLEAVSAAAEVPRRRCHVAASRPRARDTPRPAVRAPPFVSTRVSRRSCTRSTRTGGEPARADGAWNIRAHAFAESPRAHHGAPGRCTAPPRTFGSHTNHARRLTVIGFPCNQFLGVRELAVT